MSTDNNQSLHGIFAVDRQVINEAIARGRRERSEMFWTLLGAMFGSAKASGRPALEPLDRTAPLAR